MLLDASPGRSLGFPPRHWLGGVVRPKTLLRRLQSDGGELILTFPYKEHRYHANVYALPTADCGRDAGYIKQQYSHRELATWLNDTGAELLEIERWRVWTEEHWTVRERPPRPTPASPDQPRQPACVRIRRVP